jgi:hypothetical protein
MAHIKTRVEQGVGCKVQVSVPEAGKKGPFTQNLPGGALIRRGKLISHMKNPPFVFHKVSVSMIFPITGYDCAFIGFHYGLSPCSDDVPMMFPQEIENKVKLTISTCLPQIKERGDISLNIKILTAPRDLI